MKEERKRQMEESTRRDEEMRQQMELIRGIVTGARGTEPDDTTRHRLAVEPKVPVVRLNEAYLLTF